ncbi:thiamine pyrophosphate-dependent enzyme [Brunnivagina elsteri]|uniref:Acetolactate synthase n=1 Tax=Brunnivagina elsteri CCALA 953 TaxID=987040 RepID=A0A2A2TPJ6_9CYAN|nr:thiamine pyrophosphate-dependent enzyme [Calothrix elsteri]PAX60431.1 acetolactate synthase [Calothrix elsteri CCALA 953]
MLLTDKALSNKISSPNNSLINPTNKQLIEPTVADTIVQMLTDLGVRQAFGIGGGGIVPIWDALEKSSIEVLNFRHESGSAFAATEAYFTDNRPVAVFATTGPGITNVLTGIMAARGEGAKVILLSGSTSEALQGKFALQETSRDTMPEGFFKAGTVFDYAKTITTSSELQKIQEELALQIKRPGGFVVHLNIPTNIQTSPGSHLTSPKFKTSLFIPDENAINKAVEILSEPFAIWVGFGARDAAEEIQRLAELTGANVMCSPRGKGIFPESHPQFLGVTGFAGHESVIEYMRSTPPDRILVLGTRLGEFTSFWNSIMVPPKGFIHVDIDPKVPGSAYPTADTFPIYAEIKTFLGLLLDKLSQKHKLNPLSVHIPVREGEITTEKLQLENGLVRPRELMRAIQTVVVENSDATVMAEGGNSFAWAIHYLKFNQATRWRVSTGFASMGHFTTGVVGAAANGKKAVAIVGDGSMLMNNEINTAVQYNLPAVWIVLNDASYNMCNQGAIMLGRPSIKGYIAPTDFAMLARSMGADGICVDNESQLKKAISKAMKSKVPFVIDVKINPSELAPIGERMNSINKQTAK